MNGMHPQKDQVIAIIHIPDMSRSEIIENIYEWIETKRLFGSIEILQEDEDHINLKSPVRFIGTSLAARWTPEPMITYFITFTYKDQEIKVDAEINYPRPSFWRSRVPAGSFGSLKCRDFLFTFFKQVGYTGDIVYRELYPRSVIEAFLQETWDMNVRSLALALILVGLLTFFLSKDIFEVLGHILTSGIFFGLFIFLGSRIQTRKYRIILNRYHRNYQ